MTQSIAHVLVLSVSLVACQAPDGQTGQGDEAAACSTDEFCAMGLSCVPKPDDILIDTTCRPPSYDGYCNTAADCVSPQVCDIRWSHYGKCAMP